MFQVLYEVTQPWTERGALRVETPSIIGEIQVAPELARRRAKGYLTSEVAMALRPDNPVLMWGTQPRWRMPIYLHLRGFGQVAMLGSIEVDALSGSVIPLSLDQILNIQGRADAIASRLTPETTPTI